MAAKQDVTAKQEAQPVPSNVVSAFRRRPVAEGEPEIKIGLALANSMGGPVEVAVQSSFDLTGKPNRRTLLTYGGGLLAAVAVSGSVGFAWGQALTNAAVYQTEQQLALAFRDGPSAAATWATLMRSNNADLMLATCTGVAVKTIEGRRACNVPLWLDPPKMLDPGGKQ